MKKITTILFIIISILLLTSCMNLPSEGTVGATTATTTATKLETITTDTTVEAITTAGTTNAETTNAETTNAETTNAETTNAETTIGNIKETTTIENVSTEGTILETLPDMFIELMLPPDGSGYFGNGKKSDIRKYFPSPKNQYVGVHYRVVGYDESYQTKLVSKWYIEIIDVYGEEQYENSDQIDYDKICTVAMRGIPTSTLYGIPVPTIGEDYFRYAPLSEVISGDIWVALYMDIKEIDGVKYLYGYNMDLSVFEGAIKITDAEENQVYNQENHYKIIAYLNKIGKSLPTFDYKIKVEDFLDELGIMEKD